VIEPVGLHGDLALAAENSTIVMFAHGSGSSRHSPRNRYVAEMLQQAGFGTLLLDLLTAEEEQFDMETSELRFDIGLLTQRLVEATRWLIHQPNTQNSPIGYFGASTGAAAALKAAALQQDRITAIVSRGGRADLAGQALSAVRVPTLLIVGGLDTAVIDLNQQALELLNCEKQLSIVPGASHLFEEPGALKRVSELAADWFRRYQKK
jgi:dienelactone hydrolase